MTRDALVVGINQYPFLRDNPASRAKHLTTPASDAEAIAQLLENYGDFQVRRLPETNQDGKLRVDPKKSVKLKELQDAIAELFHPKNGQVPETAVLFFAGHGLRRSLAGGTEGYLVTSDPPKQENWGLSLQWLRQLLHESPVRQQVIWLDCCHSGELLNFAETDLGEYEKGRDRCFIVASRDFQVAYAAALGEHGVLSGALIQGLDPTLQPDKWVTNFTLVDFVKQALKEAPQHPICTNSGGQIILTGEQGVLANICPYKGLAYFDFNPEDPLNAEDPKYFFGRTNLTKQLLEKVRESNFLAVLGASGSGKSSVVRAGLLYQLYLGEAIPGSDTADATLRERWKIYPPFTPGSQPLVRLKEVIGVEAEQLEPLLNAAASDRVVLVIDQFEEVFTECRDKNERQKFFKYLMGAIDRLGKKLCLVLVMRSDFQGQCDDYPELAAKIDENLVRVMQMSQEELREAIIKPAEKVGLEIERELVTQMIADVEGSPGDLPLLQYALTELWEQRKLNRLTISDYTRLGGVKKALEKHANEVYEDLSTEEKQVAKLIFLELTRLGEGTEDTRRQVRQQDLVNSKQSQAIVDQVVQHLAKKKLIVTGEQEWEDQRVAIVNIAHEALIRNWNLLAKWLKENQVALLRKQDIEDAAQAWRDNQKRGASAYLLRDTRLAAAEDYIKRYADMVPLSKLAEEFVHRSIEERRKSRLVLFGSVATFIVGVGTAALIAFVQRNGAIQSEINAQIELAESRLASNDQLGALVASLKAGKQLKQVFWMPSELHVRAAATLQQTVYTIQELNRFQWESREFNDIKISPDGQIMVAASLGQISLWHPDGTLIKTFNARLPNIRNISFSLDGKTIAETSSTPLGKGFSAASLWNRDGTLIKNFTDKEEITTLDFSLDNKIIVSGNEFGKIQLWSRDGILLKSFQGHDKWVTHVKFSPNGQIVVSASADKMVKLWKLDGTLIFSLKQDNQEEVYSRVNFSPDGAVIALFSAERWRSKQAKLWNIEGKLLKTLDHNDAINSVSFSPDGQIIATASSDKTVKLWSRDGTLLKTLQHDGEVYYISFSPDGKALASASADRTVKLWSRDGNLLEILKGHNLDVREVIFSPDGKSIASASSDNTMRLWKRHGTLLNPLQHKNGIENISFSPDSQLLASASQDGKIKLWSRDGTLLRTLNGHSKTVKKLVFSPDSQMLASASEDGTVRLWYRDGTLFKILYSNNSNSVYSVTFSPNGQFVASANQDGTVKIWRRDGTLLKILKVADGFVESVQFSLDSQHITTVDVHGDVKTWSHNGKLLKNADLNGGKVSPNAQVIVDIRTLQEPDVAAEWGSFILYNSDGKELATLKGHNSFISDVAFSSDGRSFATAGGDNIVKLWSFDGEQLATLRGHTDSVKSVSFSPDNNIIATASDDTTVKLWNRNGTLLQTLKGHTFVIERVIFSPDGKLLASFSNGRKNEMILWNLDIDNLMTRGCDWARPYLKNNFNVSETERHLCDRIGTDAQLLVDQGRDLARDGNIKDAVAKFQQAKKLQPDLKFDSEAEAQLFKASEVHKLVEEGNKLVWSRNMNEGIAKFQKAFKLDNSTGKLTAPALLESTSQQVKRGKIKESIAAFKEVGKLDTTLKIDYIYWYNLCWFGALQGYAVEVIDACDKAVLVGSQYAYNWQARGTARALIGNKRGAIEDFEVFIIKTDSDYWRSKALQWINALQAGKNPFTPEEIKELLK